jgi:CheY-like chemotaxis protein
MKSNRCVFGKGKLAHAVNLFLPTRFALINSNSMHVFVVDADADDVELFCEAILEVNPTIGCVFAKNGREAFDLLQTTTEKPFLIFTEINMPIMDGIALIECIKKHKALKDIPIIVYTAAKFFLRFNENEMVDVKVKCLELGASQFIEKPSTFGQIVETIKHCLASYQKKNNIP